MQPHASPFLDSSCKSPSSCTPPCLPPVSLKPDVERHLGAVFGKALTVCLVELWLLGSSLNVCDAWVTVKSHHMLFVSSTSHKKFSEGK